MVVVWLSLDKMTTPITSFTHSMPSLSMQPQSESMQPTLQMHTMVLAHADTLAKALASVAYWQLDQLHPRLQMFEELGLLGLLRRVRGQEWRAQRAHRGGGLIEV